MNNASEKVNEVAEEKMELAKRNTKKMGDALSDSAKEARSQVGDVIDSGTQQVEDDNDETKQFKHLTNIQYQILSLSSEYNDKAQLWYEV
ncbi:unnamed protein product [Cylindrotheca closterium]|uniref:Uncharacterized protein n=1 Tax=Cylindrotheca closterium TaxID=2856 RepID=A0AAD2FFS2_9STRA|nr:unnamed protein product [Cylindrotheca closterium]